MMGNYVVDTVRYDAWPDVKVVERSDVGPDVEIVLGRFDEGLDVMVVVRRFHVAGSDVEAS